MQYYFQEHFNSHLFIIEKVFKMSNKNALSLIAQYGGDSSEDEVPYGRVSTKRILKESDDEQEVDRDPKRVFNK